MNIVASLLVLINALIPQLADENVANRYAAQMELQAMASKASRPGAEAERVEFGTILAGKVVDESVPQPARVWMVRQLEYMGGAEAVNSLTKLMRSKDAELRECSRRALEKNSAPEASASLRAELKNPDTVWVIGIINSLGRRGDTEAVPLIARSLNNEALSTAAAQALGRIASQEAVDALSARMATFKGPAVAESLIEAGNRLLAKGNVAGAQAIYTRLYGTAPVPVRAAALSGLIKVNPSGAAELVEKALTGNEPKLQQAAISATARANDKSLSGMIASLLPRLNGNLKAQAIGVLENPSAEPQVVAALADTDETVRRAALESLGRIGTAASVPVLLNAATEDGKPGKSTAEAALAKISGAGAVAALEKAAGNGEAKQRVVALNALAARKDTAALPAIVGYAGENDSNVRRAAFSAVKAMGADNEVEPVAKLAMKSKSPEAFSALEAVAGRVQDKSAACQKILTVAGSDEESQAAVLDSLSALGGKEGLAVVVKLLGSGKSDVQEAALRALVNWPDFAAMPKLMELVASEGARHNQAMQGIVRLVKTSESESAQARVDAALAAWAATRTDEEKKLVLSALATVPHAKAADTIKPLLTSNLKAEAGFAGIGVAELLIKSDKDAAKALAQDVKAANINRGLNRRADAVLRQ